MATATPTRTLADVYRERLEAADTTDELGSTLHIAIHRMAPYTDESDLRPTERDWLDGRLEEAQDRARDALIAAVAEVFGRELPRLLPRDGADALGVPPDLYATGDAINEDAYLAAGESDR